MIVLFWDIDGTLLTTGKAGVPAWEQAVREIVQRDFQLSSFRVAGLTDYQIAVRTFEMLDVPADEAAIRRMVGRYEALLPTELPKKHGRVLPNVREILEHMSERSDVRSYLLTGNTRGGARAKLTHYDLFHYFVGGAFAEDAGDRATIAARAIAMARSAGPVADDGVFVVGDTPHDIECANAIGARTVAVATGGYTLDELQEHRPWRAFDELPAAEEFARLIDGARLIDESRRP
jgi:phosphoglycolate phosphatase-like HAD superfamily hydrolase